MASRHSQRQQLLAARQSMPAAERIAAAEAMADHLLALTPWRSSDDTSSPTREGNAPRHTLAGYWAVRGELSLHSLLARGRDEFIYCLPCIEPGNRLGFAPWRVGDDLQPNRYGIPEPTLEPTSRFAADALDVVLLPLTGFDRRGNRLGSGAGYYDRTLAFRRDSGTRRPLLIGVGYTSQELPDIDAADWDVAMDLIVTDHGVIDCAAERMKKDS